MNTRLQHNPSENLEEYLEALWISEERGQPMAKISWVTKWLGIAPSSVFEMFKKLEARGFVTHYPYQGIQLTAS